ncbi:hypothetical protein CP960_09405 [Malaciobacter halophilus]|uniref:Ankyrin repeat domain-containing protein n=1 Tax=Malaciobacter halophilus TaxID=197482 RepID=A0A2N1J1I1_9BACT|nr:ankyrin repeat domain-containing protein [Malaciobacter halophilus]AXH10177.1 ankyrin domain-containing protein [Malaciobacter halophilus]PKI80415.1 hypothetical protein CP960_09405 [Malaciobacter halophilus]
MSLFKKFFNFDSSPKDNDLIEAINSNNVSKVQKVLQIEDINKEDEDLKRPIDYALMYSSLDVAKYLIDNGAVLDDRIEGQSVICYLISKNASLQMLEYVYSLGASCELEYSKTPLETALEFAKDFATFEFVFKNFGTKTKEGARGLIHEIIDSKKLSLDLKVKVLTVLVKEYNFDINHHPSELPVATRTFNTKDIELLKELIKLGACINSIAEQLPNHLTQKEIKELSSYVLNNKLNKAEYIIGLLDFDSFKQYIESLDDIKDKQILIYISKSMMLHDKQRVQLAQIALQKGANINELNNDGHSVNAVYTYTAHFTIGTNITYLDFLLENGAKIEYNQYSAFFNVVKDNDVKCVKYLIKKGADVNFVNYFRNTVVNLLIHPNSNFKNVKERIAMFDILLENGLDINIPISHYQNAKTNDTEIIEAFADIADAKLIEHLITKFPSIKVNELAIEYVIKREDIPFDLKKRIIEKNPYVVFENMDYCEVREERFDSNILGVAIISKDEKLVNYILDTYSDIKGYSEAYSYIMKAVYYKFDIQTIKKLIKADPDLNREYYIFPNEPETQTVVSSLIRGYDNFEIDEDVKVELLQCLKDNGAIIDTYLNKVNKTKTHLDRVGILINQVVNRLKFEPKVLDFLLDNGVDPYKPVANLNESQMHSIINRFRLASDELCLQHLEYFESKGYKVDLEHKNSFDTDIFLGACMMNRPKVLKWLINKGANIDVIGGFDNSPALHKAISNYNDNDNIARAETVKVLVQAGCDIEQVDVEQFTPLMSAANYGCFEALKVLLDLNANANFVNEEGQTAAHRAILGQETYDDEENSQLVRSKMLAALKDAGANLDMGSNDIVPVLHLSILENKREIFDVLLKLQLDINAKDMNGRTAIMIAIAYGEMYYVNRLMSNKEVDLNVIDSNNESIHFSAVMRSDNNSEKMLKFFLQNGIELTSGRDGLSLLHVVGYYANIYVFDIVKELFEDINIKDSQGFTPLMWACYSNLDIEEEKRIEVIKLFLENGANINERLDNGMNALALSVLAGFANVANTLIENNCDVQVALNSLNSLEGVSTEALQYLKSRL